MQTINKDRLYNDLQRFFCIYQQAVECPTVTMKDFTQQEDKAYERFKSDSVFHARVQSLTHSVMVIVEKNSTAQKEG
jgi:hypothetical protein